MSNVGKKTWHSPNPVRVLAKGVAYVPHDKRYSRQSLFAIFVSCQTFLTEQTS